MWELKVELEGVGTLLERKIGRTQRLLEDWSPLWPAVAAWFYAMEAETFGSEGRGSWSPLAPATQRERARHGYGAEHPILVQTKRLSESLMGTGEGAIRVEQRLSIRLGTNIEYAIHHQTGTGRMPARPPIGKRTDRGQPSLYQVDATTLRRLFAEFLHSQIIGQVNS